jgi:hypothetical protein
VSPTVPIAVATGKLPLAKAKAVVIPVSPTSIMDAMLDLLCSSSMAWLSRYESRDNLQVTPAYDPRPRRGDAKHIALPARLRVVR